MSWTDPRATQAQQRGNRESLFLNLKDELRVRIVGDPEFFERHWTRGRMGKDVTVRCPGTTVCPICAMGDKPRVRAIFPVLDRKTGKMKLMDVPQIVVGYIKALKEGEWGDPVNYDLTIKQLTVGKKIDYQVIPNMPVPLSAIDGQEIRRFFETVNFKKYATPHSNEEAMAILNGTALPKKDAAPQTPAALPPGVQMPPAPQAQYAPAQVPTQNYGNFAPAAPQAPQAPQAPAAPAPQQHFIGNNAPAVQQPAYIPPAATPQIPNTTVSYPAPGVTVTSGPAYIPPAAPQAPAPVQVAPPAATAVTDQMLNQFMPGK